MKTRVGIIGTGFGVKVLLPAFRSLPGCAVTALCASTPGKVRRCAEANGVPKAYRDWRAMVSDPEIDAVAIATVPSLQSEIVLEALEHRKAVFCEKPFALTSSQGLRMFQKARRAGLPAMIDFEFPETGAFRAARRILVRGGIGRLRHVAVSWNVEIYAHKNRLTNWKTRPDKGGGALYTFAPHCFHYMEWFLGPVKRLSCHLHHSPDLSGSGDSSVGLHLESGSGVAVNLLLSTDAIFGNGHRIEFYGDDGKLILDNPGTDYIKGFQLWRGRRRDNSLRLIRSEAKSGKKPVWNDGRIVAVALLAKKFLSWIKSGKPQGPGFKAAYRTQQLMEAAKISHQKGRWVTVNG